MATRWRLDTVKRLQNNPVSLLLKVRVKVETVTTAVSIFFKVVGGSSWKPRLFLEMCLTPQTLTKKKTKKQKLTSVKSTLSFQSEWGCLTTSTWTQRWRLLRPSAGLRIFLSQQLARLCCTSQHVHKVEPERVRDRKRLPTRSRRASGRVCCEGEGVRDVKVFWCQPGPSCPRHRPGVSTVSVSMVREDRG